MSFRSKQELLQQTAPRYQEATETQKVTILNEFVAATGYARKYAIRRLNHPGVLHVEIERSRVPRYGPAVQEALHLAWLAANRICAKRLIPFLPTLVESLERHGHLQLTPEVRTQLLTISSATADRLLRPYRVLPRSRSMTRAGTLLKKQIPIRTFHGWDDAQPGFLEIDVVAHCGTLYEGSYLSTLTLTDVATGWTECVSLLHRGQALIIQANQAQLRSNHLNYREELHGVPRKGQALLQGIVRCGFCGALLHLRYSGPHGDFPVYVCSNDQSQFGGQRCQEVRAIALDAQVEQRFLEALQPDRLALALAALAQLEQAEQAERKQWELRLERARYEATRAERQYQAVEPENRLVARSLERQWEEKLRAVEAREKEYQAWNYRRLAPLTEMDRQAILDLGSDLPSLWQAETTTSVERKQMLRLVIRDVIVDGKRALGRVWVQINWQTGAYEEFWYKRSVRSYEASADVQALEQRLRELNAVGLMDAQIADILNAEGYRTARLRHPFTGATVWQLREKWTIPTVKINNGKAHNPAQWEDGAIRLKVLRPGWESSQEPFTNG